MDHEVVESYWRIVEREHADPRRTVEALVRLASDCRERGLSTEEGFCLSHAVRIGTSPELAAEVLPWCITLLRLRPRKRSLRQLAALHELTGQTEQALRIYRWMADASIEADEADAVSPQDIEPLLLSSAEYDAWSSRTAFERDLIAHLDLGRAYMEMGLLDDAKGEVEKVARIDPDHSAAKELRADIEAEVEKRGAR